MKKHIKIYTDYTDNILCEICWNVGVDCHHIQPKWMWWSKKLDYIENLILLCRDCHIKAHSSLISKQELYDKINKRPVY